MKQTIPSLFFLLLAGGCGAPKPWDRPPPPPWPHLAELERRFEAEDYVGCVRLARTHRHTDVRDRDRILFLTAESHFRLGQFYRACEHYLDLVDAFPYAHTLETAGERLHAIARETLEAGEDRVRLPNTHRTIRIEWILERSLLANPYGVRSAAARLLLADAHLGRRQYERAARTYDEVHLLDPHGPGSPEALLAGARAHLTRYAGEDNDPEPLTRAEEAAREYVLRHPGGAHRGEIDALLREIRQARIARARRRLAFHEKRKDLPAMRYYEAMLSTLEKGRP